MEALNRQALRILRLFGNDEVKRVITSVGPEQEYFLVTEEMYERRTDLRFTGRTLFGAKPPKGPAARRPLLRRHQAARGGFHGRFERGAVEARRAGEDRAQRGRAPRSTSSPPYTPPPTSPRITTS